MLHSFDTELEERDDVIVWDPVHKQKTKVRKSQDTNQLEIAAPDDGGILQWWPISMEDAENNWKYLNK